VKEQNRRRHLALDITLESQSCTEPVARERRTSSPLALIAIGIAGAVLGMGILAIVDGMSAQTRMFGLFMTIFGLAMLVLFVALAKYEVSDED